jgi:hypothetical protein
MPVPTTILEQEGRFIVGNARPKAMRVLIMIVAPLVLAFLLLSIVGDVQNRNWIMIPVRLGFAFMVSMAALFSLFGAETVSVEGGELVWRRGKALERRAKLGDVEKLEREGNQLRIHVRGEPHPIIVGAGLRQPPGAMQWLSDRLEAAITAARTDTRPR